MGAVVRASLGDHYALQGRAAARAGIAVLLVDPHVVVVFASFAPQVVELVERCAAVFDAKLQHANDAFAQQV